MSEYKRPIEMVMGDLVSKMVEDRENAVVAQISQQIGVNVDKDELMKALAYDRDQYNKGFTEGYKCGLVEGKRIFARILMDSLDGYLEGENE